MTTSDPAPQAMDRHTLERASTMMKVLGHPLRLELVDLLYLHGEKTVNDLAELCGQSQPTVSVYLSKLKSLGLLASRRSGHNTYYQLRTPHLPQMLVCLRGCCASKTDATASI